MQSWDTYLVQAGACAVLIVGSRSAAGAVLTLSAQRWEHTSIYTLLTG